MQRYGQRLLLLGFGCLPVGTVYAAVTEAAADHGLQGLIIKAFGIVIVAGVFIYTVKCFLWPGEKSQRHIKRRILRDHW